MAFLMGTTLGFLKYNFNPASIFMGDTGALFLGFILGATTLVVRQKGIAIIALSVPMVVLAIPLLDTLLSFQRRLRRARAGRFFEPDRYHLHHRLLDLGLSQKQVVLSLYYLSACMGLMAFIFSVTPAPWNFLILLLAVAVVAFGVIVLRFIEGLSSRRS
jgi:UDP-GlcNAc:undecaprenyl-phosphate GlcNAc-1-phosphate transferase